eukprot:554662-Hanusia_phi.AAC.1
MCIRDRAPGGLPRSRSFRPRFERRLTPAVCQAGRAPAAIVPGPLSASARTGTVKAVEVLQRTVIIASRPGAAVTVSSPPP